MKMTEGCDELRHDSNFADSSTICLQPTKARRQQLVLYWSETTLNYRMMAGRYPNLKEEVGGGSNPR